MKKTLLLMFFIFGAFYSASADKKAEEIINKHLEARGGKSAFDKFNTLKVIGSALNPMTQKEAPYMYYYKKPGKFRIEVTFEGESMIQAFDGRKGWIKGNLYGANNAVEIPSDNVNEFKKQAEMFAGGFSEYKERGYKLKYEGDDEIDKEKSYKISVQEPNGNNYVVYISQLSYLVLKQEITREVNGKKMMIEVLPKNYKEINGMMVPQEIITQTDNPGGKGKVKISDMKFKRFDVNKEIKDKVFELPSSAKKQKQK